MTLKIAVAILLLWECVANAMEKWRALETQRTRMSFGLWRDALLNRHINSKVGPITFAEFLLAFKPAASIVHSPLMSRARTTDVIGTSLQAAEKVPAEAGGEVCVETLLKRVRETSVHAKLPESEFICTHHGTFHADEVMACAMLKCLPEYADLPILRTRNQSDIEKAVVVADVGGVYDAEQNLYDHHQNSFVSTYSDMYVGIKLSSAGLVYKHFATRIIESICGKLEPKALSTIVSKTYDSLIRELDAIDNGVQIAEEPQYQIVTHLSGRIGRLNPSWREPNSPELENARFKEAMELAGRELVDTISEYATNCLPAYSIVRDALETRKTVHASGEIIKLPQYCPWAEHLFDLEAESEVHRATLTKYVLYPDSRGGWRVQAAPKVRGSFENRLPLPKVWRGLRDAELDSVTGIPGGVFVHASGFIGGHSTEEGVLEMASKALDIAIAF